MWSLLLEDRAPLRSMPLYGGSGWRAVGFHIMRQGSLFRELIFCATLLMQEKGKERQGKGC